MVDTNATKTQTLGGARRTLTLGLHHQAKPMLRVLITLNDKKIAKLHPMVLVDVLALFYLLMSIGS